MHHGLMVRKLKAGGDHLAPLFIELIPCNKRRKGGGSTDDFDKELGKDDIGPTIEMAQLIIGYILACYKFVFADGVSVLDAFLSFIDL